MILLKIIDKKPHTLKFEMGSPWLPATFFVIFMFSGHKYMQNTEKSCNLTCKAQKLSRFKSKFFNKIESGYHDFPTNLLLISGSKFYETRLVGYI